MLAGTEDQFAARLAAAPVDGKANAALLALVADRFGVRSARSCSSAEIPRD
ncbi:DUF167 family protein [Sphingomonas sp. WKB10]|nr:DUF167 family protein [Sphingomonas sp. WKB10]